MNAPQLPAHLQRYQSRDIGQTLSQNLGTASPPYVSIQGGRFTLIDAAGNEAPVASFDPAIGVYLDACIIDVGDHISRVFYATKFDPSAQSFLPPDCWSDNGIGPSISASNPQSATCNGCPNAVWGSAMSAQGKQIPACSMVQKVALLIPAYPQTIFLLRVPPNSHKHLRAYVELCRGNGTDLSNLMTRISFDQTTQGTLLFKAASWIDEAAAVLRQAAWDEKKTDGLVGRNDVPRPADVALGSRIPYTNTLAPPDSTGQAPLLTTQPGSTMQSQQVQPVTPFVPAAAVQQAHTGFDPSQNPSGTSTTQITAAPAGGATSASPSEPAPAGRRRRRTAAEMAQANAAPGNGQAPQQPAAAPQAPFPHPGQTAAAPAPGSEQQGSFGIAQGQPAAANPALSSMLDDFFSKG